MRILFTAAILTAALIPASDAASSGQVERPSAARYCLTAAFLTPVLPGSGRECPAPINIQTGAA